MKMPDGYKIKRIRNVLNDDKIIVEFTCDVQIDYVTVDISVTNGKASVNEN